VGSDSLAVVRHIGYREIREIKCIQPAAADDLDGFQAGFIEDPSNFDGQLFEIAAVDSHALKPLAVRRHFLGDLHRFARAGEGIVSVDEQDRIIRKARYKSAKSVHLLFKTGDKGMRHGSDDGNTVFLAGLYIARLRSSQRVDWAW